MKQIIVLIVFLINLFVANKASSLEANYVKESPIIDGKADDAAWRQAKWYPLDALILGDKPTNNDFSGQFKVVWDENKLYLLAEITDDILFDQYADPLYFYWDDDCLEIFIDEDRSGGNHQFNFNAFAYHVGLDNQVVDIGYQKKDGSPDFLLLNEHLTSRWQRAHEGNNKIIWEVAIDIYDDKFAYTDQGFVGSPIKLNQGKKLGFMLAYCDNDGSKEREHFVGSTEITAVDGNKNLGYIDASVFDELILVKRDNL